MYTKATEFKILDKNTTREMMIQALTERDTYRDKLIRSSVNTNEGRIGLTPKTVSDITNIEPGSYMQALPIYKTLNDESVYPTNEQIIDIINRSRERSLEPVQPNLEQEDWERRFRMNMMLEDLKRGQIPT